MLRVATVALSAAAVTAANVLHQGRVRPQADDTARITFTRDGSTISNLEVKQDKDEFLVQVNGSLGVKRQPLFARSSGPTYQSSQQAYSYSGGGGQEPCRDCSQGEACHPKCHWDCGSAACDEVCDPVCAPPQCETACKTLNLATCRQKCDTPKCAIVCPQNHCDHGGCPKCKTICAPPTCHTECAENCESKCSHPQCTWKCNPGACEQPKCKLNCDRGCAGGFDHVNARPPPFASGMTVTSKGLAGLDPSALGEFASQQAQPELHAEMRTAAVGTPVLGSGGGAAPGPAPVLSAGLIR